ncbi:hypothetical protein [Escherichia phage PH1062]|nr:hypothetical protein [Escherichia phage PH1062]
MKKYRIVMIRTETAFSDPVIWFAVQKRVAWFWWVTVEKMGTLTQARYWLHKSGAPYRKEKVVKVIE